MKKAQQVLAIFQVKVCAADHIVYWNARWLSSKFSKKLVGFQDILKQKMADVVTLVNPFYQSPVPAVSELRLYRQSAPGIENSPPNGH